MWNAYWSNNVLHNGHKSADVVLFDIIIIILYYFIIVTILSLPRFINDLPLIRILCLSLFSLSLSLSLVSPLKAMNSWFVMILGNNMVFGYPVWMNANRCLYCDFNFRLPGERGFLYWQEIRGCVSVGWNTNQSIGGDNQLESAAYMHCIGPEGHGTRSWKTRTANTGYLVVTWMDDIDTKSVINGATSSFIKLVGLSSFVNKSHCDEWVNNLF